MLQVSATSRQLYILPFFAPLALVAAQAIDRLPRQLHLAWDYLSRILFGTAAALAWAIWAVMADPAASRKDLTLLGRWLPLDWTMPIEPALVIGALALTVGWLTLLPKLRTTGVWRGALSWAPAHSLHGGHLHAAAAVARCREELPLGVRRPERAPRARMERRRLHGEPARAGESEAPMLYYFSGIQHTPIADAKTTRCTWMIVQGVRAVDPAPGDEWKLFWTGARPGDNEELLRVYVRTPEQHVE